MTLQEVIKSGKRFKRPKYNKYLFINYEGVLEWEHVGGVVPIHKDALLATDWEIENGDTAEASKNHKQISSKTYDTFKTEETRETENRIGA